MFQPLKRNHTTYHYFAQFYDGRYSPKRVRLPIKQGRQHLLVPLKKAGQS